MRVGFVDDDRELASLLAGELDRETVVSDRPEEAISWVEDDRVDCLLTDLKMDSTSGLDLLEEVQSIHEGFPVVIMTGHGSIDTAVDAMKEGAIDYVEKPLEGPELRAVVERIDEQIKNKKRLEGFRENQRTQDDTKYQLVGASGSITHLRDMIERLAPQPMSVLIKGETGTGKEIIARQLHARSPRSESPMMTVNCAAIPGNLLEEELFGHKKGAFTGADETKKGKLELADGGTVFLDEIGELPVKLQPKLLRVLEQGEVTKVGGEFPRSVDVRFLAATNRDIQSMVEDSFRKDLYYRLNSLEIKAPPLREHPGDIPALADHFLDALATGRKSVPEFTNEALEVLRNYDWPGNVRELKNVVERSAVLVDGDRITVDDLPEEITDESHPESSPGSFDWQDYGETLPDAVEALEMRVIEKTLRDVDGNKAEAARRLGISRQSLQYKLNKQEE